MPAVQPDKTRCLSVKSNILIKPVHVFSLRHKSKAQCIYRMIQYTHIHINCNKIRYHDYAMCFNVLRYRFDYIIDLVS